MGVTAEEAQTKIANALNGSALTLAICAADKFGIMDAMQDLGACTSEQVAKKCGVNERYVQELLAVLYTSGLVEHDTKSDTFTLPSGVAALMVPSDSSLFGSFAQLVPTISRAYSSVINNGFIHGGGPSYADYGDFHEVMVNISSKTVLPYLKNTILPFAIGSSTIPAGTKVMELGCGCGNPLITMAEDSDDSCFFEGVDLCKEPIEYARQSAEKAGVSHKTQFRQLDLSEWDPQPEQYDLITVFDAIHDQAYPQRVLSMAYKALKPGGTLLIQEMHSTSDMHDAKESGFGPFLYGVSLFHCMATSMAQRSDAAAYGTMMGENTARNLIHNAGFEQVSKHSNPDDAFSDYFVCKK